MSAIKEFMFLMWFVFVIGPLIFIEQGAKSFREVVCEPVLCWMDDFDPTEE